MKLAKRTRFGRLLCRLFGEETGQTMMEYVVLGVLVVAAAVAVVLLFGKSIRNGITKMIYGVEGRPEKAAEVQYVDGSIAGAEETAGQIAGGEAKSPDPQPKDPNGEQ